MSTSCIEIKNASVNYNKKKIFSAINLLIPIGKWIGIIGESGVGKTTFLNYLAGLISDHSCEALKHQIAYMPQTGCLLPWLNVIDNITLASKLCKQDKSLRLAQYEKAQELLTRVGLTNAKHFYPHQLSGGMKQRVSLIRTLLQEKPIILMDEPFNALDVKTRFELQALAAELLKDRTVIFITHDPNEALRLAHHIYLMSGYPASLKQILTLDSTIPRALTDQDILTKQAIILKELLN